MSDEECISIWKEFEGQTYNFEQVALDEYYTLAHRGKRYGLGLKLISYDFETIMSLNGIFSCYCNQYNNNSKPNFSTIPTMITQLDKIY